ncbi:hypothetical protein AGLY_010054 [Aphis glycines]|uniref:Uncharacterized protein n=1 Tax=Aphis glycines TaxID=307491 RepID=A0A6G0TGC7_APHGL|nr:hypothetical protein AGLY_010054 [Aphis glycines]
MFVLALVGKTISSRYLENYKEEVEGPQIEPCTITTFVSKTDVSPNDYVRLRNLFSIPSLSTRRSDIDEHFLTSLLNSTLDAPNLLAEIPFKVPTNETRNLVQFQVPHHSTAYGYNHPLHIMLSTTNNIDPILNRQVPSSKLKILTAQTYDDSNNKKQILLSHAAAVPTTVVQSLIYNII